MRARLLLAGGTMAFLAVLIAAVLLLSGGEEEHTFSAAPTGCVDAWNKDPAAVTLGQHQSVYHHYAEVQVLTLTADGAAEATDGTREPSAPSPSRPPRWTPSSPLRLS